MQVVVSGMGVLQKQGVVEEVSRDDLGVYDLMLHGPRGYEGFLDSASSWSLGHRWEVLRVMTGL
jgi:hypothetical protein